MYTSRKRKRASTRGITVRIDEKKAFISFFFVKKKKIYMIPYCFCRVSCEWPSSTITLVSAPLRGLIFLFCPIRRSTEPEKGFFFFSFSSTAAVLLFFFSAPTPHALFVAVLLLHRGGTLPFYLQGGVVVKRIRNGNIEVESSPRVFLVSPTSAILSQPSSTSF